MPGSHCQTATRDSNTADSARGCIHDGRHAKASWSRPGTGRDQRTVSSALVTGGRPRGSQKRRESGTATTRERLEEWNVLRGAVIRPGSDSYNGRYFLGLPNLEEERQRHSVTMPADDIHQPANPGNWTNRTGGSRTLPPRNSSPRPDFPHLAPFAHRADQPEGQDERSGRGGCGPSSRSGSARGIPVTAVSVRTGLPNPPNATGAVLAIDRAGPRRMGRSPGRSSWRRRSPQVFASAGTFEDGAECEGDQQNLQPAIGRDTADRVLDDFE